MDRRYFYDGYDVNSWETSKNEHDWTPVKYLNVLRHNRTQSICNTFSNILQKYYRLLILRIFFFYLGFLSRTFTIHGTAGEDLKIRLSACQKWSLFLTYFLRYCKDIANLLLWVIWKHLIMPINNDNINLVENFDAQSVEIKF